MLVSRGHIGKAFGEVRARLNLVPSGKLRDPSLRKHLHRAHIVRGEGMRRQRMKPSNQTPQV